MEQTATLREQSYVKDRIPFTKETMHIIHDELERHHMRIIPLRPEIYDRIRRTQEKAGIEPYSVKSLANLLLTVYKNYGSQTIDPSYRISYINDQGHLEIVNVRPQRQELCERRKIEQLRMTLTMRTYTKEQCGIARPIALCQWAKKSDIRRLREMLRMPDIIDGIPVDAEELRAVLNDLDFVTGFNPILPIDWEIEPTRRHIGNNITTEGLTVEDYIMARYTQRKLQKFMKDLISTRDPELPGIYSSIIETIRKNANIPEYDNWINDRLDTTNDERLDPPNPDAYNILTKINAPRFERNPENKKSGTFDRIRIYLGVKSKRARPDRLEFIKTHRKDIVTIALLKIMQNGWYKKYGVPIRYLKPTQMTLTNCDEIELIFELKI